MQGKTAKGESKKLAGKVQKKEKEAAGWAEDKAHDVLDGASHAAEVSEPNAARAGQAVRVAAIGSSCVPNHRCSPRCLQREIPACVRKSCLQHCVDL